MSFVAILGRLINTDQIASVEIDQRFYMNGSASFLVVKLKGGSEIRRENGYDFDAYREYDRIKKEVGL